jgi:hypothetical protein
MIYANVNSLANQSDVKVNQYKRIVKHLSGILKADAVDGIDLDSGQKQAALDALVDLETAAADTTAYMAVRNATEPVE